MPPLTFGFRALESSRAAVVKVGHLTIPFPIHIVFLCCDEILMKL